MEVELVDVHTLPEKSSTTTEVREFAKDETVLARFGKQQQLRVSSLPCVLNSSRLSFGMVFR